MVSNPRPFVGLDLANCELRHSVEGWGQLLDDLDPGGVEEPHHGLTWSGIVLPSQTGTTAISAISTLASSATRWVNA